VQLSPGQVGVTVFVIVLICEDESEEEVDDGLLVEGLLFATQQSPRPATLWQIVLQSLSQQSPFTIPLHGLEHPTGSTAFPVNLLQKFENMLAEAKDNIKTMLKKITANNITLFLFIIYQGYLLL
jgi:hypothetical protein